MNTPKTEEPSYKKISKFSCKQKTLFEQKYQEKFGSRSNSEKGDLSPFSIKNINLNNKNRNFDNDLNNNISVFNASKNKDYQSDTSNTGFKFYDNNNKNYDNDFNIQEINRMINDNDIIKEEDSEYNNNTIVANNSSGEKIYFKDKLAINNNNNNNQTLEDNEYQETIIHLNNDIKDNIHNDAIFQSNNQDNMLKRTNEKYSTIGYNENSVKINDVNMNININADHSREDESSNNIDYFYNSNNKVNTNSIKALSTPTSKNKIINKASSCLNTNYMDKITQFLQQKQLIQDKKKKDMLTHSAMIKERIKLNIKQIKKDLQAKSAKKTNSSKNKKIETPRNNNLDSNSNNINNNISNIIKNKFIKNSIKKNNSSSCFDAKKLLENSNIKNLNNTELSKDSNTIRNKIINTNVSNTNVANSGAKNKMKFINMSKISTENNNSVNNNSNNKYTQYINTLSTPTNKNINKQLSYNKPIVCIQLDSNTTNTNYNHKNNYYFNSNCNTTKNSTTKTSKFILTPRSTANKVKAVIINNANTNKNDTLQNKIKSLLIKPSLAQNTNINRNNNPIILASKTPISIMKNTPKSKVIILNDDSSPSNYSNSNRKKRNKSIGDNNITKSATTYSKSNISKDLSNLKDITSSVVNTNEKSNIFDSVDDKRTGFIKFKEKVCSNNNNNKETLVCNTCMNSNKTKKIYNIININNNINIQDCNEENRNMNINNIENIENNENYEYINNKTHATKLSLGNIPKFGGIPNQNSNRKMTNNIDINVNNNNVNYINGYVGTIKRIKMNKTQSTINKNVIDYYNNIDNYNNSINNNNYKKSTLKEIISKFRTNSNTNSRIIKDSKDARIVHFKNISTNK